MRRRAPGRRERASSLDLALKEVRVETTSDESGSQPMTLVTSRGNIICRYHSVPEAVSAVVWVSGAGGGLDGPAGGLYPAIARDLAARHGISSLRLHYRLPNHLEECVLDTLISVEALRACESIECVALVGHSFGGAVVIAAGTMSAAVAAVAPLSSQTYGAHMVGRLAPRPVFFLHGADDEILPPACSVSLHDRAGEPRQIKIYPHARHGLDECRAEVIEDLSAWLVIHLKERTCEQSLEI